MSELPVLTECPFCDHAPRYQEDDSAASGGYNYWVLCGECGATSDYYATPEEAATAWNRRTPQPVTPAGGEVGPFGWYTEDHETDKSATTYDPVVAERWRNKGWPVWNLYTHPPAADAALVDAARDVLSHREGTQPIKGWLRDNDASRTALTRLDAALNQRGGGDRG